MHPVCLHSREEIEAFLRQNLYLHLYEIGDLDDFFWQYTTWYAHRDSSGQIAQLALIYSGTSLPVLLGLSENAATMRALLQSLRPFLPRTLHAHLSGDAVQALAEDYAVHSYGEHYKMALTKPECLALINTDEAVPLTVSDRPALERLYSAAYPGNWFDARMLETGQYFGIWRDHEVISTAGIHVFSPRYRVAALGNVTTHPAYRSKGFGTAVSARLCQSLLAHVDHIGLNVKADNANAIATYEKLGFSVVASYAEYGLTLNHFPTNC